MSISNEKKTEQVERLREIQEEMNELLEEAGDIITELPDSRMTWARAEFYWWAHIKEALYRETEFCGGRMITMDETIEELEGEKEE